ncbi:AbiV family abortive infection protein [Ramlibacter alkalitolerans]|uniref:AbiV family abortive infection protein n=1 Tax=Ramlibacter alkalitolerans TaxID=2039631 RepID=A0ABS1JSH2_9BURK|nr:AbiV family abortive infection protein [Ramlibacter alkalitolerans]MBL0427234.1 AbiV family abortive infection protein [Ramlibacter alkalitolerans]
MHLAAPCRWVPLTFTLGCTLANRTTLSKRKYRQLALKSLRNALRLLRDAIALYESGSFPTAFQLAVLAMEEYAKAKWVDHVYEASITNGGFGGEEFEQSWLKLLYLHPTKQEAFVGREYFEFSPKLLKAAADGSLERKKQAATYVGLPKKGKKVDVNARVSTPQSIRQADAKQMISLIAREVRDVYRLIERADSYFFIEELNEVLISHEAMCAFGWKHGSGLKSVRFRLNHGMKKPTLRKVA